MRIKPRFIQLMRGQTVRKAAAVIVPVEPCQSMIDFLPSTARLSGESTKDSAQKAQELLDAWMEEDRRHTDRGTGQENSK